MNFFGVMLTVENPVGNFQVRTTNAVKLGNLQNTVIDVGTEMTTIIFKVGAVGLVISVMICGLLLAFANGRERSNVKTRLVWVCVGAILFFAVVSLIGLLVSIGDGLF